MPASYLIDVARGVVFSRGWGVVTDDDIMWHVRELAADSRFAPHMRQVYDFSGLTAVNVTSDGVRRVADRNPFHRVARRAIVVPSDVAFGLVRMYSSYTDGVEFLQIFRALEPAMEWIGLESTLGWPIDPPHATNFPK